MVYVYVTKTTSLSHSQLPLMQTGGAKALPLLGLCSQGQGHDWLCCSNCGWAGHKVHSGLQAGPWAELDLTPSGKAIIVAPAYSDVCYCCTPAFLPSTALGQICTGRTSDAAPNLLCLHPSWLADKGARAGEQQQKEMEGDGKCRHLPHRVRTWVREH